MTFDALELSDEDGQPVLLASFFLGGKAWRFARADQDIELAGDTYLAASMDESRIRQSRDIARNTVTLTVPRTFPIAELWRVSPPAGTVAVILKELHVGDVDLEASNAWLGHVSNVSWLDGAKAEIMLAPGVMAMQGTGLRRTWIRACPHVLYGPSCRLDREAFRVPLTLTANVGLVLTAPEFAAGKYAGGFIEWTDADGVTDWRFITEHTPGSSSVTLMTPAPTLAPGDAVDGFVGCARTIERCEELGNTVNYGGLPYFQGKNPFGNEPVY